MNGDAAATVWDSDCYNGSAGDFVSLNMEQADSIDQLPRWQTGGSRHMTDRT